MTPSAPDRLRALLAAPGILTVPGVFDAMSAKRVAAAGFPAAFMSGYTVSASRLGMPDTGLISYGEIVDQGRNICGAVSIPVIGDADTGYGNALNVYRTVSGYARAGFACAMIEDQVAPKRCGHTQGKQVVERAEALQRIRAAVDVRKDGLDILILARTDACATHGLAEAIWRGNAFREAGADIVFVEAPTSRAEMERICREIPGPQLANMVEGGKTPVLLPAELAAIGYKIALFPATLFSAAVHAMDAALAALKAGRAPDGLLPDFATLCDVVGFNDYYRAEARYSGG